MSLILEVERTPRSAGRDIVSNNHDRFRVVQPGWNGVNESGLPVLFLQTDYKKTWFFRKKRFHYVSALASPERCRFGGNFLKGSRPIPIYDVILQPVLTRHLPYCGDD